MGRLPGGKDAGAQSRMLGGFMGGGEGYFPDSGGGGHASSGWLREPGYPLEYPWSAPE